MDTIKEVIYNRKNLVITFLLCVVISFPVFFYRITEPVDGDFGSHVEYARFFLDNGFFEPIPKSHPVLQLMIIFISRISGGFLGLYSSMLITQLLSYGLIGAAIYYWIGDGKEKNWEVWRVLAASSMTFLAPFMLLALKDGLFYYGYITMANYHNPTVNLLKPVAIFCMMLAEKALNKSENKLSLIAAGGLLTILSAGIKPNFILAFLPALGIVTIFLFFNKEKIDLKMIAFGFVLPGTLTLAIQYLFMYQAEETNTAIIWAPFLVESAFSNYLVIKFFLSTMFALHGLVIFRKQLISDKLLLLGWVMFVVGIFQNYFFAESGSSMLYGNFRWSGQIVLFLLTIIILRKAMRYFFSCNEGSLFTRASFASAYVLQVIGGVSYYIYCLTSMHYR